MIQEDVAIIIPARSGSTRLKNKPMLDIGGKKMIEHVIERAKETEVGNIYVATDSKEIADLSEGLGVQAVLTEASLASGTDRVYAALQKIGNDNIRYIMNLQGDMPFIKKDLLIKLLEQAKKSTHDIITAGIWVDKATAAPDSNVKIVKASDGRAIYFSRTLVPYNLEKYLYHVGVYVFQKKALEKFTQLSRTELEIQENLEQLRALEHGMSIGICEFDYAPPISVDTDKDLAQARQVAAKMVAQPTST